MVLWLHMGCLFVPVQTSDGRCEDCTVFLT